MGEEFGYTGKILRVDLSTGNIGHMPTSDYADSFLGGKGIAAKIYWDEVPPEVKPFDPENRLIVMTGPLGGFPGLAASRWMIFGKSPTTVRPYFCRSNFGGSWGAQLKFAGYDGAVIQGKADRTVYLLIKDGKAEIKDASALRGKTSTEVRQILKGSLGKAVRVVATGIAAENLVPFATLLADEDSSGSSGFGAVMASKNMKAIAVAGTSRPAAADPVRLAELTRHIRELKRSTVPEGPIGAEGDNAKKIACYGCPTGCIRRTYTAEDGRKGKIMCGAGDFYVPLAQKYYGRDNVVDISFDAARLLDAYGLDVMEVRSLIAWLTRCYEAGILNDHSTGLPLSKAGSFEFLEALVKKISHREGFGDVLAQGVFDASETVGGKARELTSDFGGITGQLLFYGPSMYITTGILHATDIKQPVHELHECASLVNSWHRWVKGRSDAFNTSEVARTIARKFWGSEMAADFSTYEGKALAAKMIQERSTVKESLILCDQFWPITYVQFSDTHIADPALDSKVLSAVTGKEVGEDDLNKIGEKTINLQRALWLREGHRGRKDDSIPEHYYTSPLERTEWNSKCMAPGKDGEVMSRKGSVVDREKFERMKDEYYQLRGWDTVTGLPTRAKLEELGLGEVARDMEQRGLIKAASRSV